MSAVVELGSPEAQPIPPIYCLIQEMRFGNPPLSFHAKVVHRSSLDRARA